ncbi:hypothetical protein FOZ62_006571 [Perkinsus olseni]|uniref:Uncharacterized protein n=1 Tax=Perkinsus olseni TaxID=32597 RepID=A0A7J6PWB9_PEROL|nr:hypothetical protein FOZ62_006571 [Perkinsus olseni]
MSGLADTDKPEEWFRHHVYSNTEEESVSWSKLMRGGFGSVFSVSLCVFFSLLALAGTLLLDIILGYNSVIHWLALGGIEGLSTLFWVAFIRVKRQKVLWCFCACSLYSIILLGGAVITTITFIVVYPWLDDFSQSMCDRCENPGRIGGGSRYCTSSFLRREILSGSYCGWAHPRIQTLT